MFQIFESSSAYAPESIGWSIRTAAVFLERCECSGSFRSEEDNAMKSSW